MLHNAQSPTRQGPASASQATNSRIVQAKHLPSPLLTMSTYGLYVVYKHTVLNFEKHMTSETNKLNSLYVQIRFAPLQNCLFHAPLCFVTVFLHICLYLRCYKKPTPRPGNHLRASLQLPAWCLPALAMVMPWIPCPTNASTITNEEVLGEPVANKPLYFWC